MNEFKQDFRSNIWIFIIKRWYCKRKRRNLSLLHIYVDLKICTYTLEYFKAIKYVKHWKTNFISPENIIVFLSTNVILFSKNNI